MLSLHVTVDRSFVRLMLQAWPLLSLNKAQLNTAYLRQNIVETAGMQFNLLVYVCTAGLVYHSTFFLTSHGALPNTYSNNNNNQFF